MRRSSSTWRSRTLRLALLSLLLLPTTATADVCLPPLFEGGRRLHAVGRAGVMWLELLLRQHEVCWRRGAPGEKRVFVLGNSGIFGFPVEADETAVHVLNERFDRTGGGAHLYNLGFVFTYQLKDAVLLHEALRFEPDVIVHATTLADFYHRAPVRKHDAIEDYFTTNASALHRFAATRPPGLRDLADLYADAEPAPPPLEAVWRGLRQVGLFVREAAGQIARAVRKRWFPERPAEDPVIEDRSGYRCARVGRQYAKDFGDWRAWNGLATLERVQQETGTPVLVVAWPVAHTPRGGCYNARYPSRALDHYVAWLGEQTRQRGLHFLDLHDALPRERFVDSLHLDPAGQRLVADRLEPVLRSLLAERAGP